jgi:hypothetical protein
LGKAADITFSAADWPQTTRMAFGELAATFQTPGPNDAILFENRPAAFDARRRKRVLESEMGGRYRGDLADNGGVHGYSLAILTNYLSRGRFELSAHVMLPKKEIKTITVLIDGKPLSATYNANGMYLGFARPNEDNFPREGPHKVTVKAQTTTGVMMDQNWIYFYDSMIWSSQNLGLRSNKTLIKIGPFFWVVNNRAVFLPSLL